MALGQKYRVPKKRNPIGKRKNRPKTITCGCFRLGWGFLFDPSSPYQQLAAPTQQQGRRGRDLRFVEAFDMKTTRLSSQNHLKHTLKKKNCWTSKKQNQKETHKKKNERQQLPASGFRPSGTFPRGILLRQLPQGRRHQIVTILRVVGRRSHRRPVDFGRPSAVDLPLFCF